MFVESCQVRNVFPLAGILDRLQEEVFGASGDNHRSLSASNKTSLG